MPAAEPPKPLREAGAGKGRRGEVDPDRGIARPEPSRGAVRPESGASSQAAVISGEKALAYQKQCREALHSRSVPPKQ
jgi:hypothetical protein